MKERPMKKKQPGFVVQPFPRVVFLSVVVPVFNEEEVIQIFHNRLSAVLSTLSDVRWEIIYVNDGSTDLSLTKIMGFMEKDSRVQVVDFSRNFGKEAALTAGIDNALGDAAVFIDADLQDPPPLGSGRGSRPAQVERPAAEGGGEVRVEPQWSQDGHRLHGPSQDVVPPEAAQAESLRLPAVVVPDPSRPDRRTRSQGL